MALFAYFVKYTDAEKTSYKARFTSVVTRIAKHDRWYRCGILCQPEIALYSYFVEYV